MSNEQRIAQLELTVQELMKAITAQAELIANLAERLRDHVAAPAEDPADWWKGKNLSKYENE